MAAKKSAAKSAPPKYTKIHAGWYALKLRTAYSTLDEAEDLADVREAFNSLMADLKTIPYGGGYMSLHNGFLLVVDKLPSGAVVGHLTHQDWFGASPADAWIQADKAGAVTHNLSLRYLTPSGGPQTLPKLH